MNRAGKRGDTLRLAAVPSRRIDAKLSSRLWLGIVCPFVPGVAPVLGGTESSRAESTGAGAESTDAGSTDAGSTGAESTGAESSRSTARRADLTGPWRMSFSGGH